MRWLNTSRRHSCRASLTKSSHQDRITSMISVYECSSSRLACNTVAPDINGTRLCSGVRSKRRMRATGWSCAITMRASALSMPASRARRSASTSPRVTARWSPTLGNLPKESAPWVSRMVHLGRMPPSDVPLPCRYARSSAVSWLSSTARDARMMVSSSRNAGVARAPSATRRRYCPVSSRKRRAPTRLKSSTAIR